MILLDTLQHYGTPRHSGRYPWGSGKNPYQSEMDFIGRVKDLKSKGMSGTEIAKAMGMSTTQLRAKISVSRDEIKKANILQAQKLKDKGYSNRAIAERMGTNESNVRNWLKPVSEERAKITATTANMLKDSVSEKGYIDIGTGVERHLGISRTKFNTAIDTLKEEGYKIYYVQTEQLGTGKKTTIKVLAPPDAPYPKVTKGDQIRMVTDYSEDGGRTYEKIEPPRSVDSSRIRVCYAEDGGTEKDGVIELRRGVDDISLGNARYAQVRIAVDDTHYLKGMAMYRDDMPPGVDIVFNTNKHKGTPFLGTGDNTVAKHMKDDSDNPFGASIKWRDEDLILAQRHYIDKDGNRQLSALNVVNEEGNWSNWRKSLSSQMLSKQPYPIAEKQLNKAYDSKKNEFDEIMALTNPTVKKKLLDSFADDCDASAVHLKAAALPRQGSHVILPFTDMSEKEIYAPNYRDGEQVALIRYPHGGKFEIPTLIVNNKHEGAKKTIGDAIDAVGIHKSVADRLSGADFDGDSVLVIPTKGTGLKTSPPLKALEGFDPKEAYPAYEGMKKMDSRTKQIEMGKVSNLITDMTIRGATDDEIARAVKHSMVVIDAEKHNLNYKKSYTDNSIGELKKKYQGGENAGASTLISKASSEERVPHRKEGQLVIDPKTGKKKRIYVDPTTGKKLYETTGEVSTFYYDKVTGKQVYKRKSGDETYYVDPATDQRITNPIKEKVTPKTTKSTKMYEREDAMELSSGSRIEEVYGAYANNMKALGNRARKESLNTEAIKYSPSAAKTYEPEVKSLRSKLNIALKNAPLERQAQLLGNSIFRAKKKDNPDMDADDIKKAKGQALVEARIKTGANKQRVKITDREWEAIQSGAVSNSFLKQILDNTDLDRVKQLATPKQSRGLSSSAVGRARSMLNNGATMAEVADALGVSVTTIRNAVG